MNHESFWVTLWETRISSLYPEMIALLSALKETFMSFSRARTFSIRQNRFEDLDKTKNLLRLISVPAELCIQNNITRTFLSF